MAPAGDARDPRPGAARRARRHDPTVPDVLRNLRRRAQGAARRHRQRGRLTPVVLMVVAVGAVAMFAIITIWYLFARGPQAATASRADFDREYDELVAKGEAIEGERDAAWRDSHGWQVENERDRLAWEEAPDE